MNVLRAISLFAVLGSTAVVRADFIVNGSFEEPVVQGNIGFYNNIAGWYAEVGVIEIGYPKVYGVVGHHGNQVLELDATFNSTVSQDLVLAAGDYEVSFLAGLRVGTSPATNGIEIQWNGAMILFVEPTSTTMTAYSTVFSVAGGNGKLSLVGAGISDSIGSIVDRVTLVPEPATMWALALGVILFVPRRRTR